MNEPDRLTVMGNPFPRSLQEPLSSVSRQSAQVRAIRLIRTAPPALLADVIDKFLMSRRVRGCTARTLEIYERNLRRFCNAMGDDLVACTPAPIQRYLMDLRGQMKLVSLHQHYRCLKTFFAWTTEAGLVADNPMRGTTMKSPKTLPRVPDDDEVRRLLAACPATLEGCRNKALVALLADSGLRISEALRLRVEDIDLSDRTVRVRGGKGQKDGVTFFATTATSYLRSWLSKHPDPSPVGCLFCNRYGMPLTRHHATHILHRLSTKAGLATKIGPHALRHYAGTSILRRTGDLDLVRQVLRHETLTMALRYTHLTRPEVSAKFRRASPLDNLNLVTGR